MKQAPTQAAHLPPFNYPHESSRIYAIAPDVTNLSLRTLIETKLTHLHAMLAMTYGDDGLAFSSSKDERKDEYLWACSMLAHECRELFEQLESRRAAQ